ncbi:MAG TPA: lysylphosphatidylglycerol synthase transmembrane domain-containing protein [Sediminibacterium sp.]|nr:lysylphosphatidylglycerol synthase transmembrane domain-containing protein [Sediminibacterium sp.]
MKIKWLSVIQYLIFFGIGIFLVWWSLHQIPDEKWEDFKGSLKTANYGLIVPVFLILSLSHVIRSIRWKILMKPMGYSPGLINVFFAVMIGYLANLAIPRLGEVLRCTILSRYEKIPADKLIGTILVERAFDVICLGLVFVIAFIGQYDVIGGYAIQLFREAFEIRSGHFQVQRILIILLILTIAIIALVVLFKKLNHLSIVTAVKKIIRGIWEGLISIRNLQQKGLFLFYSAAIWALYIGGTWVGLLATTGTAGLGLPAAISALAFASIGMIITPGGIGAYAFFLAKVLEKNGVSFEIGFANGTLQWFAQFIIILMVGFVCLGLLPWYNKKHTV